MTNRPTHPTAAPSPAAADQQQFLNVIDRDEAERRFHAALRLEPLAEQTVDIDAALGRILARDVVAGVDVPSFDRSNFDGYAVRAADTFAADEERPARLRLTAESIATAVVPQSEVGPGRAMPIATGGMLPRGADAIVMVEHADTQADELLVRRAVTPGFGVSFAGTDITAGETVLRRGDLLTSRETGVLAAVGIATVAVRRCPRVGIISTGDEIIEPGKPMRPGMVYDSNARIIADAVRELGGEPVELGIVADSLDALHQAVTGAIESCDIVLLSGGTSKGAGDLSYHVVGRLDDPGIVAHGVALKPGKPICLAATAGKPVVILPGFPTSAIFTFHEFVAPVIRRLAGRGGETAATVPAVLPVKVNSEIGRTEYLLVGLVEHGGDEDSGGDGAGGDGEVRHRGQPKLAAYPMGKGSGSVTTFSRADGFITIGRHVEIVDAGSPVTVQLLGRDLRVADLVVIGSHCVGLDYLLGKLHDRGFVTKFIAVGSMGGLDAARRGECDLAPIHLLDETTSRYNEPFIDETLSLIRGYGRMQGVLFRPGDPRFAEKVAEKVSETFSAAAAAIDAVKHDPACIMVNRNPRSGTRILIDRLLDGTQPPGYAVAPRSHNAVAAAITQHRADWGVAIQTVADQAALGFLPLTLEQYDFVTPKSRLHRPAAQAMIELLDEDDTRRTLRQLGFHLEETQR